MRILFVASLHHPPPGPLPPAFVDAPADPLMPPNQAHHFWVKALRRLGHDCAVFWRSTGAGFWSRRGSLRMGRRATPVQMLNAAAQLVPRANPAVRSRNRALLSAAARFGADVVILVGGNDVVLPETIAALRARQHAKIVYASGTSPVVFSHPIEREAAPLYDLVVVNDRYHGIQWRELGAPRADVLPLSAIDPDFHRPKRPPSQNRRVVFVGTLVPGRLYSERVAALEALTECGLDIWSVHEAPVSLRQCHRGAALGERMVEVLQDAAIAVNPHGNFMRYGGNMRLFEACGVGVLQVTDDRPGTHEWFTPGEHLLTYQTPDDLRRVVAECLGDDGRRRRIAEAGCAHVHAHHTYDHRMRRLVDLVLQLPRP